MQNILKEHPITHSINSVASFTGQGKVAVFGEAAMFKAQLTVTNRMKVGIKFGIEASKLPLCSAGHVMACGTMSPWIAACINRNQ